MSETAWTAEAGFEQLERGNRWTWALGALLLVVFAGAFVILYFLRLPAEKTAVVSPGGPLTLAAALLGLVLVFGLYALQKQRTLARLREELIQRHIQEESLRSRLGELSALFDVAGEVNLQLELDPLLEVIARRVLTCLESDRSSIFLLDDASKELICRAVSGTDAAAVREARIQLGEGIAGWVAENNEPLVLNDDDTVRRFAAEVRPGRGICTALCVPIAAAERVLGVMNLSRIEGVRPFTAADARLMQIFAETVASAIVRIRQFEALDEKAGQLERAKHSLESMNRMKEVFLAAVHGELKGPCNVLNASADYLTKNEPSPERGGAMANVLREQVRRLESVTGRIRNLSRLEDPDARTEPARRSPNRLATEISESLAPAASARGLTVATRLEPGLGETSFDPELFTQAALALAHGAMSVAPRGAETALATRSEENGWIFEVRSATELERRELDSAWSFFGGGERPDGRLESLGLGLYLARRIGELHGGGASAFLDSDALVLRIHLPIHLANGHEPDPR